MSHKYFRFSDVIYTEVKWCTSTIWESYWHQFL